jgi:hypothetical protein
MVQQQEYETLDITGNDISKIKVVKITFSFVDTVAAFDLTFELKWRSY